MKIYGTKKGYRKSINEWYERLEGLASMFGIAKSKVESILSTQDIKEPEPESIEMEEIIIFSNLDELKKIHSFFEYATEQYSEPGKMPDFHLHYRDWDKAWTEDSTDLIIMTGEENDSSDEDSDSELEPEQSDFLVRIFPYDPNLDSLIYEHENTMRKICQNLIKKYSEEFKQYGYELECAIYWNEFMDWRRAFSERIPYKDGYNCFFRIGVKRDGKYVCYDAGEETLLTDTICFSNISYDREELIARLYDEDEKSLANTFERMLKIAKSL